MKYYEYTFNITTDGGDQVEEQQLQDARDILSALAAEAGFEAFEETATGLKGYVQPNMLDEEALGGVLSAFPMSDMAITFEAAQAEDRNWNEAWEKEGFEPIAIADTISIHDGRHLPADTLPISIEIDAHQAFGTGTHQTTRLVAGKMLEIGIKGMRVLDCGCGTGILAICAMKLGAASCTAYDIDEWSVENTRHNAVINQVELSPLLGDSSILETNPQQRANATADEQGAGLFDVVVANIHRNIIIADMPVWRRHMAAGAHLVVSGFYVADIPAIEQRGGELGLRTVAKATDGDWACVHLRLE